MAERNITNVQNEWISPLLFGCILFIIGILMAVYKRDSLVFILMAAGVLMVISGAVGLAIQYRQTKSFAFGAIIILIIGIIFIIIPGFISDAIMVLIAIGLILYGVISLFSILGADGGLTAPKAIGVIIGAVSLIIGIYAILNLNTTADVVMIIIGATIAVLGILQMIRAYRTYVAYR